MPEETRTSALRYGRFLLFIASLGGLLYGVDVGIIAAALLYLSKTIDLTVSQTSSIVAAVLGGGMVSSLVAGALADWFGRKKMMAVSGLVFVISVGLIVLSRGFVPLLLGRLLQGASGGIVAVVVPLYLAESLPANKRGQGTAVFQFMLTFGIVLASVTGWFFTRQAEIAIAAAAGNSTLILAAENHAWRSMFFTVIYPGIIFFLGALALSESPRWLMGRGRTADARAALRRSSSEEEAEKALSEMQELAREQHRTASHRKDSLFQKKYAAPFLLACLILTLNQTTGINSILAFLVVILEQAGMAAQHATQGDVAVKVLNCAATVLAIFLVDKKGRKFLLKLGTGGATIALAVAGLLCLGFESQQVDIRGSLQAQVQEDTLNVPLSRLEPASRGNGRLSALTVLYDYGSGTRMATALDSGRDALLHIQPERNERSKPLVIERALLGPVPPEQIGWFVAAAFALFIASYAVGPGVVVWLALSELMPTRIRSVGMGVALLLNQGASTLIAALFLPAAGDYGYHTVFFFWAVATAGYFLTAAFLLPETKGKTLEEIEKHFEK